MIFKQFSAKCGVANGLYKYMKKTLKLHWCYFRLILPDHITHIFYISKHETHIVVGHNPAPNHIFQNGNTNNKTTSFLLLIKLIKAKFKHPCHMAPQEKHRCACFYIVKFNCGSQSWSKSYISECRYKLC